MLISKPHTKGDIVTIKLTSDTEIITRFVSQDEKGITFEKPMAVSISSIIYCPVKDGFGNDVGGVSCPGWIL